VLYGGGYTGEIPKKCYPPANTVALVVDVSPTGGGILKVHHDSPGPWGNESLGNVGSGDGEVVTTQLIIIPWSSSWWYRYIGQVRVRYIVQVV
jgi:hypothetical protein